MTTLILSEHKGSKKIEVRKDLIIAMESLEDSSTYTKNKTRLHLKGGTTLDVIETIGDIRKLM